MNQFYNNAKTFLLLAALSAVILIVGQVAGGRSGLVIALGLTGVMNFVSYFYSDKIALAAVGAEEVGPEHPLYRIVEPLAAKAGLPMPRVYVSSEPAPNAFATGRSPSHAAVCATQGLLDMLNPDEIAGVMSHELGHVKHRDILITTVAATLAGAITFLVQMMWYIGPSRRSDDDNDNSPLGPVIGILAVILAPIAALLIQAAISRSREFNADTEGANIVGGPMPLATALEKIHAGAARIPMDVNPAFNALFIAQPLNAMETMAGLFSTHPPLEARLMNLIGRPAL